MAQPNQPRFYSGVGAQMRLAIAGVALLCALPVHAGTTVISLDGNKWRAAPDPNDAGWREQWWKEARREAVPIRVPGVLQECFPAYHGVAWYWTEFALPTNRSAGGRVLLRFEAVNYKSDFWLGGTYLGGNENGESPFEFDITNSVRQEGLNRLAVRVLDPRFHAQIDGMTKDQSPRRGGPAFQHGGIEGSVALVLAPPARITDLYARPDPNTGALKLFVTLRNASDRPLEGNLRVNVSREGDPISIDGKVLHPFLKPGVVLVETDLQVDSPLRWDIDSPHLYRVTAHLDTDATDETTDTQSVLTGFRDFRFEHGAFRLNGRRVLLRSVQHSHFDAIRFWIPYDFGSSPDYFERRLIAAKEMGFNCIRIFGGVPPRNLVELADRIGLMLYVESNASWELRDSLHVRQRFEDHISRMILRDRNHPSIVIWGLLNETHAVDHVAAVALESLPLVRHLDPTRVVMFNSGRYDFDLGTGSISNPGNNSWQHLLGAESPLATEPPMPSLNRPGDAQAERLLQHILKTRHKSVTGDLHHYAYFPLQAEERRFYREVGAATKPVFFSEFGRGSAIDVVSLYEFYEKHNATHLETAMFVKKGRDLFINHWNDYRLDEIFKLPKEFFSHSMARSARDRKELLNAMRSNPKISGFNNVSLSERIMIGQGLLTLDGKVKPGMMEAMRDALAPARFCLFAEPINVYTGQSSTLDVVLANADALPAGEYPLTVQLRDGSADVVFERETVLVIPGGQGGLEPPLALPVLKEAVLIDGQEGRYELIVAFKDGREIPGSREPLYVYDRQKMPDVETEVTVWGQGLELRTWLAANRIPFKEFDPEGGDQRELILVSAQPPAPGGREAFEPLVRSIARGSAAVFLSEKVFADGTLSTRWLPLKGKGIITKSRSWLYGRDEWVKDHPVFEGLQNGGLMDLQFYRELLAGTHPLFTKIEKPQTAMAGAFQTSSFDTQLGIYHYGLITAEYPLGAGRILLNTLLVAENLGRIPQAERLLRNMINYMSRDLASPVALLPADFDSQLAQLYGSFGAADPEIAIMAPAQLSKVKSPGTVAITVWTSEPEVRVSKVEFYSNGQKIGEDRFRKSGMFLPFEYIWGNVPPGTYELTAKAIHEDGGATISPPITIQVEG